MIKSDDRHRFFVPPTGVTGNETGIDNPFLKRFSCSLDHITYPPLEMIYGGMVKSYADQICCYLLDPRGVRLIIVYVDETINYLSMRKILKHD